MARPFASFVVLNYDREDLLKECLASLAAQSDPDYEVVVVDNGSSRPWRGAVPEALSGRLAAVEIAVNAGYARANNLGIAAAKGEWIVWVNNDAVLAPDFLAAFRRERPAHPDCRLFAPQVLISDFPDYIDSAGLGVFLDGIARCRAWQERAEGHQAPAEVFGVAGSVAVIHSEVFRDVGIFDEDFFLYLEDLDFSLRARWKGYACRYLPVLKAWHKHSSTVGKHTAQKAYFVERNHVWAAAKNFPWPLALASPLYTVYRYALQGYAAMTHQGITHHFVRSYTWPTLAGVLLRAYRDAIMGLPGMLRKRREVMAGRRLGAWAYLRLLLKMRLRWRDFAFKD